MSNQRGVYDHGQIELAVLRPTQSSISEGRHTVCLGRRKATAPGNRGVVVKPTCSAGRRT